MNDAQELRRLRAKVERLEAAARAPRAKISISVAANFVAWAEERVTYNKNKSISAVFEQAMGIMMDMVACDQSWED